MTDQTIPVPVDLLKDLRERYRGELRIDPDGLLAQVTALIPSPPKVGDALTAAGVKAAALPERSVLIDSDGDVWVTSEGGSVYLSECGIDDEANPSTPYEPYLLVHIGRD